MGPQRIWHTGKQTCFLRCHSKAGHSVLTGFEALVSALERNLSYLSHNSGVPAAVRGVKSDSTATTRTAAVQANHVIKSAPVMWHRCCIVASGKVPGENETMRNGRYRESRSSDERRPFLATLPAERNERRLPLRVVMISAAIFLSAVPFAKVPIGPVWAFIPIYQSALVINDVITAVLLFGQFAFLRSRGVLVLAVGYLFTALMAVSHMLTFPGVFAPTGLLGAGPQSTAWMFMFWHGGFPLCVVAYALLKQEAREPSQARGRAGPLVLVSVGAALVGACGFTLLATAGQNLLPPIMHGNSFTATQVVAIWTVWGSSLLALLVLWRRRPHSVLDLWLMVVMCAWLFDIALAGMLNAARFDLGFYAGRMYGLLAATFVLSGLLVQNGKL